MVSSALKDKRKKVGFKHAVDGILLIAKMERNFRIHLIAAVLTVVLSLLLEISTFEWLAVVLVIGMVLTAEMANSAFEKMIDYLKPELHPAAKGIKDIAAGSVLISAVTAVIVGIIIFLPKIYGLLEALF